MTVSTAPSMEQLADCHAQPAPDVILALQTDAVQGLSSAQVDDRHTQSGRNVLVRSRQVTIWHVALEEITEPMILLLLAIGLVYALWGEPGDALAIVLIVGLVLTLELGIEYRAKRAVAALSLLASPRTTVIRTGTPLEIDATDLVPGDIVLLRAGERVPADLRLIVAQNLHANEAALTGESLPVDKDAQAVLASDTPLADRVNLVYAGTIITHGSGRAVVVGTGMNTEIGRIVGLTDASREPKTPLQQAMKALSGRLVFVALAFSIGIPLVGMLMGQPFRTMILTGMTLAFATIPEEMPIIVTMVLAVGALGLSGRHVLVKRLRAAETLGAVTVLCVDKTGTLTENTMTVAQLVPAGPWTVDDVLRGAVLATERGSNDPTDLAVLQAGTVTIPPTWRLRDIFPFNKDARSVTLVYAADDRLIAYTKGAVEAVLALAAPSTDQAALQVRANAMAAQGMRVLGVGYKALEAHQQPSPESATRGLTILGLVGLSDPPRAAVPAAVEAARAAGLRIVMLTGDHPVTAAAIARDVGLADTPIFTGNNRASDDAWVRAARTAAIFARVLPEHKLRLVRLLQADRQVVAMTGDGVNDAPALKAADVGVAMGIGGTDVAREAASLVLTDNNFASLVTAVTEGRRLYANLRKGTRYYLAIKMALITSSLVSVLLGLPVLFTPIQIIVLELFMDVNAALGFAVEPADPDIMRRPPRHPGTRFLDRSLLNSIIWGGTSLFLAVMAAYLRVIYTGTGDKVLIRAQTSAFLTWLLCHALLALVMRREYGLFPVRTLFANRVITTWASVVTLAAILAVTVPALQNVLNTIPISRQDWAWVIGLSGAGGLVFVLAQGLYLRAKGYLAYR